MRLRSSNRVAVIPRSSVICSRLNWAHAADLRRLVKSASRSTSPRLDERMFVDPARPVLMAYVRSSVGAPGALVFTDSIPLLAPAFDV